MPASRQAIFKGCAWRGDIPEIRILVNNGGRTMWRPVVRGRFSRDPADTRSDLFMRQVRVYPGEKRLVVLRGDPQPRMASKTGRPACEMAGPPQHHH